MNDKGKWFRFRASTPWGTFQTVGQQEIRFAVTYQEERAGRWMGFCYGWAADAQRAQRLADEVRERLRVEPLVVSIAERRPWMCRPAEAPDE